MAKSKTFLFFILFIIATHVSYAEINEEIKVDGKKLFEQKCSHCHGTNFLRPRVPILYGQEPGYIVNQIKAYKTDERVDRNARVMNSIAKGLKDKQVLAIAKYLAGEDPCDMKIETIDPKAPGFMEKYKAGRELVRANNCMHCHGSFHHAAPRLHGQRYKYLKHTLGEFMSGDRKNKYMDRVLPILSEESIEHLSTYFSAQMLMRECN